MWSLPLSPISSCTDCPVVLYASFWRTFAGLQSLFSVGAFGSSFLFPLPEMILPWPFQGDLLSLQEDQREANEMAEGRSRVTSFFFIVSQPHNSPCPVFSLQAPFGERTPSTRQALTPEPHTFSPLSPGCSFSLGYPSPSSWIILSFGAAQRQCQWLLATVS